MNFLFYYLIDYLFIFYITVFLNLFSFYIVKHFRIFDIKSTTQIDDDDDDDDDYYYYNN